MIKFKCDACGSRYGVTDDKAGKKTRCPKCGAAISVPAMNMHEEPIEAVVVNEGDRASLTHSGPAVQGRTLPQGVPPGALLMSKRSYWYEHEGRRFGPVSARQLQQVAASGRLQPNDFIWTEGLREWTSASEAKALFASGSSPIPSAPPVTREELIVAEVVRAGSSLALSPDATVSGPKGVGGWLLVLCISLAIIHPAFSAIDIIIAIKGLEAARHTLPPGAEDFMAVAIIGQVVLLLWALCAGVSLWCVWPGAVKSARTFFGLAVAWCFFSASVLPKMFGLRIDTSAQAGPTLGVLIASVVWTTYLSKSKRVRATYPDAFAKGEDEKRRVSVIR